MFAAPLPALGLGQNKNCGIAGAAGLSVAAAGKRVVLEKLCVLLCIAAALSSARERRQPGSSRPEGAGRADPAGVLRRSCHRLQRAAAGPCRQLPGAVSGSCPLTPLQLAVPDPGLCRLPLLLLLLLPGLLLLPCCPARGPR